MSQDVQAGFCSTAQHGGMRIVVVQVVGSEPRLRDNFGLHPGWLILETLQTHHMFAL